MTEHVGTVVMDNTTMTVTYAPAASTGANGVVTFDLAPAMVSPSVAAVPAPAQGADGVPWSGPVAFENQMTGDGRIFAPASIGWFADSLPHPVEITVLRRPPLWHLLGARSLRCGGAIAESQRNHHRAGEKSFHTDCWEFHAGVSLVRLCWHDQKLPRLITTSFNTTSLIGRSRASRGELPMARRTSCPLTTSPNTLCLLSRCSVGASVMKN